MITYLQWPRRALRGQLARSAIQATERSTRRLRVRTFVATAKRDVDYTHIVVGGGAVGLSVARRLAQQPGTSTLLLEKHAIVGSETSARNSEVIHAGLYYGPGSLKTDLCLKGKQMLYDLCERQGIPSWNCGKWIVAQDEAQMDALEGLHKFAQSLGPKVAPTRFLTHEEARSREPDVCARAGVLESSSTGVFDSHAYMSFLEGDFQSSGGECIFRSKVVRIEAIEQGRRGWNIWTQDTQSGHFVEEPITSETLVNSAGLGAIAINNLVMSTEKQRRQYYAKGSYYAYNSAFPKPKTLIYPAPVSGHGGLGTHLTLDMAGQIRFGPDVQWVYSANDLSPNMDPKHLEAALEDITTYLPGLDRDAVRPDYSGIRPKLSPEGSATAGKGFQDFYIEKEPEFHGFVNLLGIESPGLTSSLAIAEVVYNKLYR